MSKPNAAKEAAQGLVVAYRNACEADLRWLIVAFVGGKPMEME